MRNLGREIVCQKIFRSRFFLSVHCLYWKGENSLQTWHYWNHAFFETFSFSKLEDSFFFLTTRFNNEEFDRKTKTETIYLFNFFFKPSRHCWLNFKYLKIKNEKYYNNLNKIFTNKFSNISTRDRWRFLSLLMPLREFHQTVSTNYSQLEWEFQLFIVIKIRVTLVKGKFTREEKYAPSSGVTVTGGKVRVGPISGRGRGKVGALGIWI